MTRRRDLFETWAVIRYALEGNAPLPEDVRLYPLEVARALDDLNEAVRRREISPRTAADSISKRLGLTARAYRAWQQAREEFIVTNVLEHQVNLAHQKSEDVADSLAKQLGYKSGRTVYRRQRAGRSRKQH
jgi:hypothetical protein